MGKVASSFRCGGAAQRDRDASCDVEEPYRTAGSGGVYVEREADIRLRRELSDNRRFPLIAAPQESGKTCLIRHTIDSLDPAGFCVLSVDLSRLRLGSPTQFMGELLGAIARRETSISAKSFRTIPKTPSWRGWALFRSGSCCSSMAAKSWNVPKSAKRCLGSCGFFTTSAMKTKSFRGSRFSWPAPWWDGN